MTMTLNLRPATLERLRERTVTTGANVNDLVEKAVESYLNATSMTFDARTVMLLCSRRYTSIVLVRNLLKFASCPGPVLGYLSKQGVVRNNSQLRSMLMGHPNTPLDARRRD